MKFASGFTESATLIPIIPYLLCNFVRSFCNFSLGFCLLCVILRISPDRDLNSVPYCRIGVRSTHNFFLSTPHFTQNLQSCPQLMTCTAVVQIDYALKCCAGRRVRETWLRAATDTLPILLGMFISWARKQFLSKPRRMSRFLQV